MLRSAVIHLSVDGLDTWGGASTIALASSVVAGHDDLKGRLWLAIRALNVVLIRQETWPRILRRRAQEISDELNRGGAPEDTIASLDIQSARRITERILHLYADCQAISVGTDEATGSVGVSGH